MPRVRCYQMECVYWKGGFCQAREIEVDPDEGCLTFELEELADADRYASKWEDELLDELSEEDEW